MIYVSSDHGGFELKKAILQYLTSKGVEAKDMGPYELNTTDDYPDYVYPLARRVSEDPKNNTGIMVCRNGVGVSVTANKVKGIRAALSWNPKHTASTRNDDNANILAIPADYVDKQTALEMVDKWLTTPFSSHERHARRLEKVRNLENSI